MSHKELAKLKKQIEELQEKKFIRLNVSLWGAPILLLKKKISKLSKCEFWMSSVSFLSHVISKGGITVDPIYRWFIEKFSKLALTLTKLTRKN
uniref:Uncharacterized protein n=1 Tax=Cajanus cajan TaxID=3821 RepID=A0A151SYX4_CAJCA|nr:hypothetical protein KK1_015415 [Cajanus cajan]